MEFLTKPFREQDLLDAFQFALDRDRHDLVEEKLLVTLRQRFEELTPRERVVMG